MDQIKQMASLKDYTRLLGLFYSYFGALELVIAKHILPENLQDIHERRKADLISQDLIRLGAPVPDLLLPGFLPAVKNYYEAFGALYVIEGSSLGGNHIAKMIRRKLPEVSDATLFFSGYGDRTNEMWHRFKNRLDNIPGDEAAFKSIQSGARDTFLKFAEWINSNIRLKMLI